MKTKIYFIDNFDSFSYNLVDLVAQAGFEVVVYRNDIALEVLKDKIAADALTHQVVIMLSPGPGTPKDAGNLLGIIDFAKGTYPILGICLGHQAIIESAGGKVVRAEHTVHGKADKITFHHEAFKTAIKDTTVARYHSLIGANVPKHLSILASLTHSPDTVMAVYSQSDKLLGFQFHPESILTPMGDDMLTLAIRLLLQGDSQ